LNAVTGLIDTLRNRWLYIALLVSAAMLATAHAFETFGGLMPCLLCLDQRKVYWVAIGVAVAGIAAGFAPAGKRLERVFLAALTVTFAVGVFIAGRHTLIEMGFLPPLEKCAAAAGKIDLDALSAFASGASKPKVMGCDVVQWRFGLSMAGWNTVISIGLTLLSAYATLAGRKAASRV